MWRGWFLVNFTKKSTFQEVFQIFKDICFLEHPYSVAPTYLLKDILLGIKQWGRKKQNNMPVWSLFLQKIPFRSMQWY